MSHDNPGAADRSPGEVEYLDDTPAGRGSAGGAGGAGSAGGAGGSGKGRWALIAGGTAAVVGVGAAGAFGVASFFGGGDAPATVVPADALGYLALDLDPGGGQKVEAYQTLKKFPALEDELNLGSSGDLRKTLVEALLEDGTCDGIDFDTDIDPWLGSKLAVAVVPGQGAKQPTPFGVLQVKDQDKARAGFDALASCDDSDDSGDFGDDVEGGDEVGTAFVDGYVVLAETDDQAAAIAEDAADAALADDAGYQKWVKEAGGGGILTAYAAKEAPSAYFEQMSSMWGGDFATTETMAATPALSTGRTSATGGGFSGLEETFKEFQGAALVARFDDGALEIESATGGLPDQATVADGESGLQSLPATTALGFGFAVSDTFVTDILDGYSKTLGEDTIDELLAQGEAETGLALPEDLQTLLGDQVTVALDGSADLSEQGLSAPQDLPISVRISGDPDKILGVVDKLLAAAGASADQVVVEEGDGVVALGLNAEQTRALIADGSLGDQERFEAALPELSRSGGALYVDLDSDGWLSGLIDQAGDDAGELRANLEPLGAMGISGWSEGDVSHGLMRLTTD